MKVKIFLFGKYAKNYRNPEFEMNLKNNSTVQDVAAKLSIKEAPDCWILLNGMRSGFDGILSNGDEIYFFQPVGGG